MSWLEQRQHQQVDPQQDEQAVRKDAVISPVRQCDSMPCKEDARLCQRV